MIELKVEGEFDFESKLAEFEKVNISAEDEEGDDEDYEDDGGEEEEGGMDDFFD